MRPPNGSLSSAGRLADGPALFPVYGWDFSEWSLEETLGWLLDLRVAAGASPAAKATLYEGEPKMVCCGRSKSGRQGDVG